MMYNHHLEVLMYCRQVEVLTYRHHVEVSKDCHQVEVVDFMM